MRRTAVAKGAGALLVLGALSTAAASGFYEFVAPPSNRHNGIWRVDRETGETGYCYFRLQREGAGETSCALAGKSAGPQTEPGPYRLVPSRAETEAGVFRVNERSGAMSLCYPRVDERGQTEVTCTDPAR
jgi:hypothetical protein